MKRIVALLLAVMMCVSLFAGCGNEPAEETTAPKVENNETKAPDVQTEAPAEFSYPTTGSITFWTYPNGNVTANYASFEVTPAAGYAEEATGIKVDYELRLGICHRAHILQKGVSLLYCPYCG